MVTLRSKTKAIMEAGSAMPPMLKKYKRAKRPRVGRDNNAATVRKASRGKRKATEPEETFHVTPSACDGSIPSPTPLMLKHYNRAKRPHYNRAKRPSIGHDNRATTVRKAVRGKRKATEPEETCHVSPSACDGSIPHPTPPVLNSRRRTAEAEMVPAVPAQSVGVLANEVATVPESFNNFEETVCTNDTAVMGGSRKRLEAEVVPEADHPPLMLPGEAKSAIGPAQAMSFNLTRVAALCDEDSDADEVSSSTNLGQVKVNGYTVKEENVSLLAEIFQNYGDIAKSCTSSLRFKSELLERVCDSLKTLQRLKFHGVGVENMELMLLDIDNVEKFDVELGWLRKRVVDIRDARLHVRDYHLVKEAEKKNEKEYDELIIQREDIDKKIELLSKERENQESKMELLLIEREEIKMKGADIRTEVKKFMDMESLVQGLLNNERAQN